MSIDILIVDDEEDIRDLIADTLHDEGYSTRQAAGGSEAINEVTTRIPNLVILDIWLQGSELDGLGVLEVMKRRYPHVPVVMISGHGNIETAVNSIKMGAYDYVEKPFKAERLLLVIKHALELSRLKQENAELKVRMASEHTLIGSSNVINQLRVTIDKVAPTESRVMVSGGPGVGKEVVAYLLHKKSKRSRGPFIVMNAASISASQVETELFGSEDKGAYSNEPAKIGFFERADGGTLFIDEISDLPIAAQGKLLRVLQEKGFERPGSSNRVEVDVRVITATNRDLQAVISDGNFREDLYYRLNVVPIQVPPLAKRKGDIPELCKFFVKRCANIMGFPSREIAEDAISAMQTYNWPGNVRQLRNVIEWLLIMSSNDSGEPIDAAMLPPEILSCGSIVTSGKSDNGECELGTEVMSMPLREAREYFERQYLVSQLERMSGNISKTSNFIGMERSALHRKLKLLNITGELDDMKESSKEREVI